MNWPARDGKGPGIWPKCPQLTRRAAKRIIAAATRTPSSFRVLLRAGSGVRRADTECAGAASILGQAYRQRCAAVPDAVSGSRNRGSGEYEAVPETTRGILSSQCYVVDGNLAGAS